MCRQAMSKTGMGRESEHESLGEMKSKGVKRRKPREICVEGRGMNHDKTNEPLARDQVRLQVQIRAVARKKVEVVVIGDDVVGHDKRNGDVGTRSRTHHQVNRHQTKEVTIPGHRTAEDGDTAGERDGRSMR